MVSDYDKRSPNYLYVQAVYPHEGRFYFIPSSFSMIGTLDPERPWTLHTEKLSYSIATLPEKICKKECPGYLDKKFKK